MLGLLLLPISAVSLLLYAALISLLLWRRFFALPLVVGIIVFVIYMDFQAATYLPAGLRHIPFAFGGAPLILNSCVIGLAADIILHFSRVNLSRTSRIALIVALVAVTLGIGRRHILFFFV